MRGRRAARRHREELGEAFAVFADPPGPLTRLGFLAAWILFTLATLIRPGETLLLAIAPSIGFGVVVAIIYLMMSGERLVVCERGLLIGSVAPAMRQYVVRWDQIVPGSVVPVTGARRYGRETGTGAAAQSTVRRSWWTGRGIHLVGPSAKEARRHPSVLAALQDGPPRSIDGRWVWFVGTGRNDPALATAAIASAAHAGGFPALARATGSTPSRELSGDPTDASRHLPGLP